LIRSLPLIPLELTNLMSESRIKSVLVEVIASSLVSRLLESPVRFSELQFCELTVNEGASTAPVAIKRFARVTYREESGACPRPALCGGVVGAAVGGGGGVVGAAVGAASTAAVLLFCFLFESEIFNTQP